MSEKSNGHGLALELVANPFTEPPVRQFNGREILDRVSEFIRRYVGLSEDQARIVTVWTPHTHGIRAAVYTPYLNINSVAKRCGKTILLEVLELLVAKPWLTGRVSPACLIRKVDQDQPTLLLDEFDAACSGPEEYAQALRGILNTGFQARGKASQCVPPQNYVKDYKTYCAKAIAGIGNLPETVADRSIPIHLERKLPGDTVSRFRWRKVKDEGQALKTELSNWISSIADRLKEAEPSLPDELSDRQQDGMEPLLAIADEAGGDWPEAVRKAAVAIFRSQAAEDQNIGVQLLADIRSVFDALRDDKISSADLVEQLKGIEPSPWADWGRGKGLSTNGLARLLKPFGISPRGTIRVDVKTAKGYVMESFKDAFSRYLPPILHEVGFATVTSVTTRVFIERNPHFPTVTKCKCDGCKKCLGPA